MGAHTVNPGSSGCGWCYLNAAHTIEAHKARLAEGCQLGAHVDVLA